MSFRIRKTNVYTDKVRPINTILACSMVLNNKRSLFSLDGKQSFRVAQCYFALCSVQFISSFLRKILIIYLYFIYLHFSQKNVDNKFEICCYKNYIKHVFSLVK